MLQAMYFRTKDISTEHCGVSKEDFSKIVPN